MSPKKKNLPHFDISGLGIITGRKSFGLMSLFQDQSPPYSIPPTEVACKREQTQNLEQKEKLNSFVLGILVGKIKHKGAPLLAKAAASFGVASMWSLVAHE